MMNVTETIFEPRRPAWSRPETVFVIASITLLAAFLICLPAPAVAVLWICSFCLAGAVTIICLAAGSSADLVGFVPLVNVLTLLRLTVMAQAARRLIQHRPADPLLQSAGLFLAGQWPLGAILIGLLLAAVVSIVVFASSQKITLASASYMKRILPLKHIGIETDLRLGVINHDQSRLLARRIGSEFRFFAGMQGAGMLMRSETAICVVILLACVLLPMLNLSGDDSGAAFLTQTAPAVTALALFVMVPLAIVAACCSRMMGRGALTLRSQDDAHPKSPARKISIVARDTGAEEHIELLNPESLNAATDRTQFVDFEPIAPASEDFPDRPFRRMLESLQKSAKPIATIPDFSCRTAEAYYEKLSRMILAASPLPRQILLAARSFKDLPVTVAVNVAIRLAQKNCKILLMDADTSRNPLAHVFDLDPQALLTKIVNTCFENLAVCAVPIAKLQDVLKKNELPERFDAILIYAPEAGGMESMPSESLAGFFFTEKLSQPDSPAFWPGLTDVPSIHSVLNV